MDAPEYACAVISDACDRLLLELRPATATHARNELTCFGGRRERFETAQACLRRELQEELGWIPTELQPVCDLVAGDRYIAQFFACPWRPGPLRTEPGHIAVWIPRASLAGIPLSPWHGQVLAAIAGGQRRCELPQEGGGRWRTRAETDGECNPQHPTNPGAGETRGHADGGTSREQF